MDVLFPAAATLAFLGFLYWQIARRAPSSDREEWIGLFAAVVIVCLMIPGCLLVESLTGFDPASPEPSFAVRRGAGIVAFVAWAAFLWRRISRQHAAERTAFVQARDAFAADKRCAACGKDLNLKRLHHPLTDDGEMTDHWLNTCECGALTFFDPTGRGQIIEDRSREK